MYICVSTPVKRSMANYQNVSWIPVKRNVHITQPQHFSCPPLVLPRGDKASCTQYQPCWIPASPLGLSRSYSGVGRCGWLVTRCNFSSASDTVQVCPLWPRLPGDCVNSLANLRKYPAGSNHFGISFTKSPWASKTDSLLKFAIN